MIEETAVVTRCDGEHAWVEKVRQSSCGQCSQSQGCGISMLDRWFGRRMVQVRALNSIGATCGDRVVLGMEEQALIKAALLLYLLPLICLLVAAMVGARWAEVLNTNSDIVSIFSGIAGLLLGLSVVRYHLRRQGQTAAMQAVILRRLEQQN